MLSKLRTLAWYLKQPRGIALLWSLLKRQTIYASEENTRMEAEEWCRQRATNTHAALQQLFPDIRATINLESAFPEEFSYAREKVMATPYKMGGQGNIDLLYTICEQTQAKYVLETGVAYGWSSLSILLSLIKRPDTLLISTDMPYPKMGNEDYVGIVVPQQLKNRWTLINESDISALPRILKTVPYLDMVHYDSDKSYVGRMSTYPKLYNKLRRGGIFISDDINDNIGFKRFCEQCNKSPLVIPFENKYVGLFVK